MTSRISLTLIFSKVFFLRLLFYSYQIHFSIYDIYEISGKLVNNLKKSKLLKEKCATSKFINTSYTKSKEQSSRQLNHFQSTNQIEAVPSNTFNTSKEETNHCSKRSRHANDIFAFSEMKSPNEFSQQLIAHQTSNQIANESNLDDVQLKKYDYNNYNGNNFQNQYSNYYYYQQQLNNSLNNHSQLSYETQYNYNNQHFSQEQNYLNSSEFPASFSGHDNLTQNNNYFYSSNFNLHSQYESLGTNEGLVGSTNRNLQESNQNYLSSSLSSCSSSSSSSSSSSLSNTISPIPANLNYDSNNYHFTNVSNHYNQTASSFSA